MWPLPSSVTAIPAALPDQILLCLQKIARGRSNVKFEEMTDVTSSFGSLQYIVATFCIVAFSFALIYQYL